MRRWVKVLAIMVLGIVLLFLAAGLLVRRAVNGSLAMLEGEVKVAGLSAPVTIERDDLGVPTIRGENRLDVARALGFVHAQERFFQMDLMRRSGAGELSALVGTAAMEVDKEARRHGFRRLARRVAETLPDDHRAILTAYVDGVNAGLAALGQPPFEYLLRRQDPEPWREEDSALVVYGMYFTLNDAAGSRESARGLAHDLLDPELVAFLIPPGTRWDAPIDGGILDPPTMPGNPRRATDAKVLESSGEPSERTAAGSNNWALDHTRTGDGRAILANDMHLPLAVPNTWYRASLQWPADDGCGKAHRVTGVTLPGSPAIIAGSNSRVAWGFTNSYGDWTDLVILETNGQGYRTPDGVREFETRIETIEVAGGEPVTFEVQTTIWGPVVDQDHKGRTRALRWIAHSTEGSNMALLDLEHVSSIDEAMSVANRTGIPPQNFVCADDSGRIGWTVIGSIPTRRGFSGQVPTSWADGSRSWTGWLDPDAYPRITDPPGGQLWTANARAVSGDALAIIGDGGYDLGARAGQIRDDLLALEAATEHDMLGVQLDDRALFYERWRDLALEVLDDEAVAGRPERALFRKLVDDSWTGRASIDSQGFRLVRAFRLNTYELVFGRLMAPCAEADERFDLYRFSQWEDSLWRLVTERPARLLGPDDASWGAALLQAADTTVEYFTTEIGPDPELWTWGRRNTVRVQHPFGRAVPRLSGWLDMPPAELPGASLMPRVQGPTFGASERFAVSPGREHDGYFHMPGGQSGHPLSPHYRAGHEAWTGGEATPFLPGETVSTLTLVPASGGS
jgi:penicillin amidase